MIAPVSSPGDIDDSRAPILAQTENGVLSITINRAEVNNKLDTASMVAMAQIITEASERRSARVITIAGNDAFFCGGGQTNLAADVNELLAYGRAFTLLHQAMEHSALPIVAIISGNCLAGGMSLLDACDLAIAAEDVVFGYPEIEAGYLPILAMATCRDKLPSKLAFEMFYRGRRLTASEALHYQLVNVVVPRDRLAIEVADMTSYLASRPATSLSLGRQAWHQMGAGGARERLERMQLMLVVLLRAAQEARS